MNKNTTDQENKDLHRQLGVLEARTKDLEEIQKMHIKKQLDLAETATLTFKSIVAALETIQLCLGVMQKR